MSSKSPLSVVLPFAAALALVATACSITVKNSRPAAVAKLHLEVFGAERQEAFFVTSTLIVGEREMILWDAQYKPADGARLAERIAATGTRLKAIVLSHADHDHYMGAMEILRRFPGTPVYMTAAGLEDFNARSQSDLAAEKSRPNSEAPDSLVKPQLLPGAPLTVDGNEVQVIQGLTGDVSKPASAALWIPSLRAALIGDLAFSGIHVWLGDADIASRAAWHASLKRIAALDPAVVVPGHKRDLTLPNSPDILASMEQYLNDFDALMQTASEPMDLARAMMQKYPNLALPALMAAGARKNFKK